MAFRTFNVPIVPFATVSVANMPFRAFEGWCAAQLSRSAIRALISPTAS